MVKNTINSGQLNQRIEIYSSEDQDNGSGGTNPVSVLYWSTNAQVLPLKSNRSLQANQELLKDGFKFTIRDRNDKTIHPDMQIKYRGSWLTIQSAIPDYVYREFMVVTAIWAERPERGEQPTPTTELFENGVYSFDTIFDFTKTFNFS